MDFINDLLRRPPAAWRDLVDILVVSLLIYEVLKLIRGTRAVQMALGAGVFSFALFFWLYDRGCRREAARPSPSMA